MASSSEAATTAASQPLSSTQTVTKGFTLSLLKESLLKCKSDSTATRERIKRCLTEMKEVTQRIVDQGQHNVHLTNEVESMKKRRDELNEDITSTNQYLDHLTKTNCDFIKEKVVNPAEEGINVAKESIDCFREIIDSSYKLNMLFKRAHPEKKDAEQQINLPYKVTEDSEEEQKLMEETLALEKELFKRQDILRDAKSIARGNKSTKGYFISLTRSEWEERKTLVDRLLQEEAELERELAALESPASVSQFQLNPDKTYSDNPAANPEWIAPVAPQAVPVTTDEDMPSFGNFSADYD